MKVILIASSQSSTLMALSLLLRVRFGCADIHTASNWTDLIAAAALQPQIILLDLDLPGCFLMQGPELLRKTFPTPGLLF